MSFAQRLIQTNPSPPMGGDALTECIRACFDCAQACTAYADAYRSSEAACDALLGQIAA